MPQPGEEGYVAQENTDHEEINADAFLKPEGEFDATQEETSGGEKPAATEKPANTEKPAATEKPVNTEAPSNVDFVRGIVGADYELPTVEEGKELDTNAVLQKFYQDQAMKSLHPSVRQMHEASLKDGFDPVKTVNDLAALSNISSMSNNAKIEQGLINEYGLKTEDNPEGFTPEDIQAYIEKLDPITLREKANAYGKVLEEKANAALSSQPEMTVEQQQAAIEAVRAETQVEMSQLFAKTEKYTDIGGIKAEPESIKSFNKIFETLVTPDKETGIAPIYGMLSNNEVLYKMAYQLHMNPSGDYLKELLSDKTLQTKEEILSVLNLNPKVISGSNAPSNEIDITALTQPERS